MLLDQPSIHSRTSLLSQRFQIQLENCVIESWGRYPFLHYFFSGILIYSNIHFLRSWEVVRTKNDVKVKI